jgi:hypothetical protein
LCVLHFFFDGEGAAGLVGVGGAGPPPPPGMHGVSVGVTEFERGLGVVSEKSTELLFVSSPGSSMVAHPDAMDRRSAMPEVSAAAGVPALVP